MREDNNNILIRKRDYKSEADDVRDYARFFNKYVHNFCFANIYALRKSTIYIFFQVILCAHKSKSLVLFNNLNSKEYL
jgi:hypothetical protein